MERLTLKSLPESRADESLEEGFFVSVDTPEGFLTTCDPSCLPQGTDFDGLWGIHTHAPTRSELAIAKWGVNAFESATQAEILNTGLLGQMWAADIYISDPQFAPVATD